MCASIFIYFKVLDDYGIKTSLLFGIQDLEGYTPDPTDVYDPQTIGRNNSNYGNPDFKQKMDWVISDGGFNGVDLRLFYADLGPSEWG